MALSRRVRGLFGVATVWTMVFGTAGVIVISTDQMLHGSALGNALGFAFRALPQWVIGGAVMGTLFGVAVMIAERRRDFAALTSERFKLWGLLAGSFTSLAFNIEYWFFGAHPPAATASDWARNAIQFTVIWGVMGAGVGAAHFRLARRWEKSVNESPVSHRVPVI